MTPVSPVGGEDVARLREQRDRAIGSCGYTVVVEGEEEPCDRESTGWRWYQGHDHEDMLGVACIHHENQGGALMVALLARLEAAESARDEALAVVERVRAVTSGWKAIPKPQTGWRSGLSATEAGNLLGAWNVRRMHADEVLAALTSDRAATEGPPARGEFCERHFSWLCQAGQGKCGPAPAAVVDPTEAGGES